MVFRALQAGSAASILRLKLAVNAAGLKLPTRELLGRTDNSSELHLSDHLRNSLCSWGRRFCRKLFIRLSEARPLMLMASQISSEAGYDNPIYKVRLFQRTQSCTQSSFICVARRRAAIRNKSRSSAR